MNAIFYAKARLPHLGIEQVVEAYAGWTLGAGTYRRNRDRRLKLGVPPQLTTTRLAQGGNFRGVHDCSISSRYATATFLLHFVHRDADEGGILWHTAVRLVGSKDACTLEHAAARSGPRGAVLVPMAASPSVFVGVLDRNGSDIQPRDLWATTLLRLPEEQVEDFVPHVLLDEERRIPYVFVAPTNDTEAFLVGPEQLAKRLAGLARVVAFSTKTAAFRFTAELKRRGFANEFGISNGSVRLFHPGLQVHQSHLQHYLWLRRRIEATPDKDRLGTVGGEVASRIVERTLPIGFFDLIEEHDRKERHRATELVLKASLPSPPTAEAAGLSRGIAERDQRIAELVRALEEAQIDVVTEAERYQEEAKRRREADDRNIELELGAEERKDELEYQIDVKDQRIRDLTSVVDEMKAQRVGGALSKGVRDALEALLAGEPTLEQCLLAIVALYPDRVTVLPDAWKGARESKTFRKGAEAFRLLRTLASEYWDALEQGKGDGQARAIFGRDNYAAKESEGVESNKRARDARTFTYGEQQVVMLRHLKIGIKDSLSETLRVHFEWMAKDKRIVIGHCGGHLPFG